MERAEWERASVVVSQDEAKLSSQKVELRAKSVEELVEMVLRQEEDSPELRIIYSVLKEKIAMRTATSAGENLKLNTTAQASDAISDDSSNETVPAHFFIAGAMREGISISKREQLAIFGAKIVQFAWSELNSEDFLMILNLIRCRESAVVPIAALQMFITLVIISFEISSWDPVFSGGNTTAAHARIPLRGYSKHQLAH